MKRIFIFFLLLFNLLNAKTIVLASDYFPPFIESETQGIVYEIVAEAFKVKGYEIKVIILPWNRALIISEEGTHDGLIALFYSKEREDFLIYSDIVLDNKISYFALKDTKINLNKLESYKIGIVRGYFYSQEFNASKVIKKSESDTGKTNLGALINKRVDVILESNKVVDALISKSFKTSKNDVILISPFSDKPLYIGLCKHFSSSSVVIKEFNEGLKEIKKNGTYKKILKKYGY